MANYLVRASAALTLLKEFFLSIVAFIWQWQQQTRPAVLPVLPEQQQKPEPDDSLVAQGSVSQDLMQQALGIILQHKYSERFKLPITMLQVSKSWRVAVLETSAGQLGVVCRIEHVNQLSRVDSLALWLLRHCSSVRSLQIDSRLWWTTSRVECRTTLRPQLKAVSHIVAAFKGPSAHNNTASAATWTPLFLSRIMAAFQGPSANNTASMAAWSSLRNLYITLPVDGSLLAVLPTSLTSMTVSTKASSTDFVALKRLENLQCLRLHPQDDLSLVPQSCMQQLSSLSRLTSLSVRHLRDDMDLRQVPGQLQALTVHGMYCKEPRQEFLIQLGHVTGLKSLRMMCHGVLGGSKLPPGLHDLDLLCYASSAGGAMLVSLGVSSLTALTSLSLHGISGEVQALRLLAPLTNLQQVDIIWSGEAHATHGVVSALSGVPGALQLLAVIDMFPGVSVHDAERVMQQLASLTRLNSLRVFLPQLLDVPDAAVGEPLPIWGHLSTLTGLHELMLTATRRPFVKQDVAPLTALRSLTWLSLNPGSRDEDYLSLPPPFRLSVL